MRKYAIGVDFGTLSGRALLVDVGTGEELAEAVFDYANGVIDEYLPGTNKKLEPDWALQDPNDYLETIKVTIPSIIKKSGVDPADVIGLGIDFTACTMLPIKSDGTPLCFLDEWRHNPHAWVKLWKHHAAQPEANRLNQIAEEHGYDFLQRYGGKISSEWFFPKAMQILDEAPEVYAAADRLIEAADWVIWQLTGEEKRNSCTAGYKAMWSKREGYPPKEFFKLLDPRLENIVEEKMASDIYPIGSKAGELTNEAAEWTGLLPGTAVAVANVDAHVSVPAATVVDAGKMVIIMGTSNCHMVCAEDEQLVPGICGYVEDGILPGLIGYEAGQSCVGDHFMWFVENCVPAQYVDEAEKQRITIHEFLTQKAKLLNPGESGLVALDWWNGNRSVLVDVDLTGLMIGMTLATKPEEMYRALMEATAYGTRMIIETMEEHGVAVTEIVAAGGLPKKNELLIQIYADITGREIKVIGTSQSGALGAALMGAVAAGSEVGGYDSIADASKAMATLSEEEYMPDQEAKQVYDVLFAEYRILHDTFGRGVNDVMKRLKRLRASMK
ncbi:MAG TPA: ribulokinase [Chloroflexi bacterium]|nr:ribulokinase [Chloroflexota bacterium]